MQIVFMIEYAGLTHCTCMTDGETVEALLPTLPRRCKN